MKIRLGARKTSLALVQSRSVAKLLEAAGGEVVLTPIKTIGDTLDVALPESGEKAIFTKEIDEALLGGKIDLAVHRMKDVSSELPCGIAIAAVPAREDPREAFVSTKAHKLAGLPKGALVGTSSPARRVQVFRLRPDLDVVDLRGDIEARLRKLNAGEVDALIISVCGLKGLGISNVISECLSIDRMIPSVGQGALALEVRGEDRELIKFVNKACHNQASGIAIRAERAFLKALGVSANFPAAAHAEICPAGLNLIAFLATGDEVHYVVDKKSSPLAKAGETGKELALSMLAKLDSKKGTVHM